MKIITRAEAKAVGLKRYFTGKPCPRGHILERLTVNATCVECMREKQAEWKRGHPEEHRIKHRIRNLRYRHRHPERMRIFWRRERENMSEASRLKRRERMQRWNAANAERKRELVQRWRANNKEHMSAYNRAWISANRDKVRTRSKLQRYRRRGAGGRHTAADIANIKRLQRNRCAYCRMLLDRKNQNVDHIIPISKGGTNDPRNLQLLCAACNQKKRAHHPLDFARSLGQLL